MCYCPKRTINYFEFRCDNFYTKHPHDDCRQTSRFPVGQNIVTSAYNFPAPPDVRSRTHEWYNEIEDFNPDWVSSFVLQPAPGKTTAHYTQLVWGWTYLLGCGRAVFHEVNVLNSALTHNTSYEIKQYKNSTMLTYNVGFNI